jgi:hypothetical protein
MWALLLSTTAASWNPSFAQSDDEPPAPEVSAPPPPADETAGQRLQRLSGGTAASPANLDGSAPDRERAEDRPRKRGRAPKREQSATPAPALPALSRNDLALRTALDFCIAIGAGDGQRAAAALDVVGYQALPLSGKLPESAEKPLSQIELIPQVGRRLPFDVSGMPASAFCVLSRGDLTQQFPAVAQWVLPQQDIVIRITPDHIGAGDPAGAAAAADAHAAAAPTSEWLRQPACVVVRIRGQRATIVGGNLLAALSPQ